MNPRTKSRGRTVFALLLALTGGGFGGVAEGYEAPDLRPELFARDGIFLADDQRTGLLEALAAIASNFPENSRVDDDLREKALALALRLDPLHHRSRLAHRELSIGAAPSPTGFFDSLSAISETLWSVASELVKPPLDPEEKRLAPFLMELSLVLHPDPPDDRLLVFAEAAGPRPLPWDRTLSPQSGKRRSSDRSATILDIAAELRREKRREAEANAVAAIGPGSPPNVDPVARRDDARTRPAPFEPVLVSLATVREIRAVETLPVAATLNLEIRPPRGRAEREWLEEQVATANSYPLIPSEEAIPLDLLDLPLAATADRSWTWPSGTLGELRLDPLGELPGPRRLFRASALLPTLVLMESALTTTPPNPEFVLLGDLDATTLAPYLPGELAPSIEAAAAMGRKYLLVPSLVFEDLVEYLQKSGRLELLVQSELVGYSDLSEAMEKLTRPTDPALVEASATFAEIRSAGERLPLAEVAASAGAQERLETILAAVPEHLSASAMLEFARRPPSPEVVLAQTAAMIRLQVEPFFGLPQNPADTLGLLEKIPDAKTQLLRMRTTIPPATRNLHGIAEDLLEAASLYLSLTNKGTSIASQRLREMGDKIAKFRDEWSNLGLGEMD